MLFGNFLYSLSSRTTELLFRSTKLYLLLPGVRGLTYWLFSRYLCLNYYLTLLWLLTNVLNVIQQSVSWTGLLIPLLSSNPHSINPTDWWRWHQARMSHPRHQLPVVESIYLARGWRQQHWRVPSVVFRCGLGLGLVDGRLWHEVENEKSISPTRLKLDY